MKKPVVKKLPNGIRLIMIPLKDSLSVTAAIFVEAGVAYEDKKINGISHFLEHMMFKGTSRRPTALQISTELENLGASYNAFTDFDLTGYHATVAAKNFDKAFDVLADMYLNPLLEEKEIEKEKGVIVEEIRMYEDLPREKVSETLNSLLYGDQPAGWSIAGTKDLVKSFARKDIESYRNAHYIASKTVIVFAGKFDPAHAQRQVAKYFARIPKGKTLKRKPVQKHASKHIAIVPKELDQSHFMAAFKAVSITSPDRFKITMLAKVLGGGMGSRLFGKIREEMGAAYYIGASAKYNADLGSVLLYGGINHGKLQEVFKALITEVKRMYTKVSQQELERAREYTIGNFLLSLETSNNLAGYYGYQLATTGKTETPEDMVRKIKKVTTADMQQMAKKYFTKDNFHFALIGPYGKSDKQKYEKLYRKHWA